MSDVGRLFRTALAAGCGAALAWTVGGLVWVATEAARLPAPAQEVSVALGADGRLSYTSDAAGNRIVDFSHAGYGGGGVALPDVPARIVVGPGGGDDRQRLQAAIDLVAALAPDPSGFRGAVLVEAGTYRISGALRISASGIVLRGAGPGSDGTVLIADGTSRRTLITVAGAGARSEVPDSRQAITAAHVPVGARTIPVADGTRFSIGDRVIVVRPSTRAWIARLGMDQFEGWRPETRLHWQPGSRDIVWDRVVVGADRHAITLDAPLTTALDARFGGGWIARTSDPGRIARVGVENLRLVSAFDAARPADEDHAWSAIALDRVDDAWVRRVTALHFVDTVVDVGTSARAITVEDVEALAPVSEVGGYRRRPFLTSGQLTLFRRCRSERGRHDFAVGITAPGPNVFLESTSRDAHDFSGPIESWASGVLYDNVIVRGHAIRLANRGRADQGQGWAAANSVLWNCEATDIEAWHPPDAFNLAFGCKGVTAGDGIVPDARAMPSRDFYRGTPGQPRSLYLAQLAERLGPAAVDALAPRAIDLAAGAARRLTDADVAALAARERAAAGPAPAARLTLDRGAFTIGGRPAWTKRVGYSWYQAQMVPSLAPAFGPAITRFAPGRAGVGLTDDLAEVAASMAPGSVFYQHYGLWYDRRRVDHNYYGSPDQRTGDVWAPFMELPWARSGLGKAWDGLSRYDLTRFNPWYFDRLRTFAALADRHGLVLYHHFYFQHWLLESRSHYVDFPWRPVNAIQDTGLPDEVPAANAFYDVSHPLRRDLHRRYIRHALDALAGRTNVVHGIDREFTGPIEFVRFWLDALAEWQREHGTRLFIALEIPKDQMDAILADPVRGPMIAAIDVLAWVYRADGALYAARGGVNRAPREQRPGIATPGELAALTERLGIRALDQRDFLNGPEFQRLFDALWASSAPMRYRAWREYRDAYPGVATLWTADEYPALTRAVEASVPAAVRARTRASDLVRAPRETAWCVTRPGETYVIYTIEGHPVDLDLTAESGEYTLAWADGTNGAVTTSRAPVLAGRVVTLAPPAPGARPWVAWLVRAR